MPARINMRIGRYAAIIVLGIKQQLAYKKDFLFSLVFRLLASVIMIAVWSAVYLNTKVTTIGGFTLPDMYVYFFLVNAIAIMSWNEGIAENMQDDVQSGTITTSLIRPITYPAQIFLNSFAGSLFSGLAVTLPVLILVSPFAHLALSPQSIAFFFAEIALSYLVSTLLFFIVGTAAIYLVYIWGVIAVTESVYFLFGGGVVPLNLLPSWLGGLFALFPMQLALYTPAATLLGLLTTGQIVSSLLVGVVWAVALFAVSAIWWRRVSVKMTSVGG